MVRRLVSDAPPPRMNLAESRLAPRESRRERPGGAFATPRPDGPEFLIPRGR